MKALKKNVKLSLFYILNFLKSHIRAIRQSLATIRSMTCQIYIREIREIDLLSSSVTTRENSCKHCSPLAAPSVRVQ